MSHVFVNDLASTEIVKLTAQSVQLSEYLYDQCGKSGDETGV